MQKTKKRWMKSIIDAAKAEQPLQPFQREYRRAITQADRNPTLRKTA